MPEASAAFVGSVPENYERYLGPLLFEPYADNLVARLPKQKSVLETACGTGIVTQRLAAPLPEGATLIATDLNEGMLAFARQKLGAETRVNWEVADARNLPFDREMFDSVVCQFGMIFVPEKNVAIAEAHRVLKPGGKFFFNVWDSLSRNDLTRVAHEAILSFFPDEPPRFFEIPFGFYDGEEIRRLLQAAGSGTSNPRQWNYERQPIHGRYGEGPGARNARRRRGKEPRRKPDRAAHRRSRECARLGSDSLGRRQGAKDLRAKLVGTQSRLVIIDLSDCDQLIRVCFLENLLEPLSHSRG